MATSHQDGLDPTEARTPEAFMQLLRQACAASGLSIAEIAEIAGRRGYDLDPAGLAETLESPTLPNWQTVTGVLTACGLGGMQIDRWMRVYHDLAAPAEPVAPMDPVTVAPEPVDVAPVSVPPLVLTTGPATPRRFGPKHYANAAGALAALLMVPLLLFVILNGKPDTVAAEGTNTVPQTSDVPLPMPLPSGLPGAEPSPTSLIEATATAPAPVTTTTTKPPTRPSSPPPPPPSSPADSGVLRSGTVNLTQNQGLDLDSGQVEGANDDIYRGWRGDALGGVNGGRIARMSGMPSKQTCQAERGKTLVTELQPGQWLCVLTSDGRYGRLNIIAVGDTMKLAYTVWT
ncbi:hypothetical protein [Allorhizocola rhizosphaerae]|uniref:hypothetical protein n=1 Tax=Allorhizocola rhizosphaerae TaxID=1872709 RepID=UPI000E3E98BB|nr:hypothetical protein [Allorhizocola rhizosphaerae]